MAVIHSADDLRQMVQDAPDSQAQAYVNNLMPIMAAIARGGGTEHTVIISDSALRTAVTAILEDVNDYGYEVSFDAESGISTISWSE